MFNIRRKKGIGCGCGCERGIAFITYITIVCDTFDAYITYTYRMKMLSCFEDLEFHLFMKNTATSALDFIFFLHLHFIRGIDLDMNFDMRH